MGYGVAITPVQMLRAYCALASRGNLPQLRLLDRVQDPATGAVERNNTPPSRQIYSNPAVGNQIVDMMVTVTEKGGTATRAAIPGYRVAGKTGTARKIENGHYVAKYFASFVGFVPAEKPAFVLLITFDEPRGSIYGGSVAGPVWRRIAERTLKYMNIPPTVPLPEKKRR
jgi:cell division protein FtsI/penicillin-binding protein 2